MCGNCGFHDTGHYCSRCGEPLHGIEEGVMEVFWSDMVEGPLHNLFALAKTTWLMLLHPHRFFHGVLRRQRALSGFPFFLAPAWRAVSHKPHGVPNAVKYFMLVFTLSAVSSLAFGVRLIPEFHGVIPLGDTLPGGFVESVFLLFMIVSVWMYGRAMSRLLGGRIDSEVLTRFMLYLNGFALIPFAGMGIAGVDHQWIFLVFSILWLYVLFVLPQVALPRLFGVSRWRLAMAQGGAAVGNTLAVLVILFLAGSVAERAGWIKKREVVSALAVLPGSMLEGAQALREKAEKRELPGLPTYVPTNLPTFPAWLEHTDSARTSAPAPRLAGAGERDLFPSDSVESPVDALARMFVELDSAARRGLRGSNRP